jgi:non-heme chloroperoxidase
VRETKAGYVLIGWSLGVLESLTFIDQHGEQGLKALVLVDNSIGENPPPPARPPTFINALHDAKKRRGATDGFVRSMFRSQQEEEFLKQLTDKAMRVPQSAAVQLLSQPYPRTYWRDTVYKLQKPVFYMVTPKFEGQAQNFKQRHRFGRVAVFENAGHALFVDEPERFNDLITQFLADLTATAPTKARTKAKK